MPSTCSHPYFFQIPMFLNITSQIRKPSISEFKSSPCWHSISTLHFTCRKRHASVCLLTVPRSSCTSKVNYSCPQNSYSSVSRLLNKQTQGSLTIFFNVLIILKPNVISARQEYWIENSSAIEFGLSLIYMLTVAQCFSLDQSNNIRS